MSSPMNNENSSSPALDSSKGKGKERAVEVDVEVPRLQTWPQYSAQDLALQRLIEDSLGLGNPNNQKSSMPPPEDDQNVRRVRSEEIFKATPNNDASIIDFGGASRPLATATGDAAGSTPQKDALDLATKEIEGGGSQHYRTAVAVSYTRPTSPPSLEDIPAASGRSHTPQSAVEDTGTIYPPIAHSTPPRETTVRAATIMPTVHAPIRVPSPEYLSDYASAHHRAETIVNVRLKECPFAYPFGMHHQPEGAIRLPRPEIPITTLAEELLYAPELRYRLTFVPLRIPPRTTVPHEELLLHAAKVMYQHSKRRKNQHNKKEKWAKALVSDAKLVKMMNALLTRNRWVSDAGRMFTKKEVVDLLDNHDWVVCTFRDPWSGRPERTDGITVIPKAAKPSTQPKKAAAGPVVNSSRLSSRGGNSHHRLFNFDNGEGSYRNAARLPPPPPPPQVIYPPLPPPINFHLHPPYAQRNPGPMSELQLPFSLTHFTMPPPPMPFPQYVMPLPYQQGVVPVPGFSHFNWPTYHQAQGQQQPQPEQDNGEGSSKGMSAPSPSPA